MTVKLFFFKSWECSHRQGAGTPSLISIFYLSSMHEGFRNAPCPCKLNDLQKKNYINLVVLSPWSDIDFMMWLWIISDWYYVFHLWTPIHNLICYFAEVKEKFCVGVVMELAFLVDSWAHLKIRSLQNCNFRELYFGSPEFLIRLWTSL